VTNAREATQIFGYGFMNEFPQPFTGGTRRSWIGEGTSDV
jgi:hypothetical protein